MGLIDVPEQYLFPPFYERGAQVLVEHSFSHTLDQIPFYPEIVSYGDENALKPWLAKEEYVPILLEKWANNQLDLQKLYQQRNRKVARPIMILSIAILIEVVWWTNNEPALAVKSEKLKWKPINLEERLSFIIKEPDHFHSFVQLRALFDEANKLFYKTVALDKQN